MFSRFCHLLSDITSDYLNSVFRFPALLAYIETDKKPNLSLFLFFPKCLHFLFDCQVNASGDVSFMANYFAEHFYGI